MEKTIGQLFVERHADMNKALIDDGSDWYHRGDVLLCIQKFITACHFIGFNALPHLQNVFFSFDWRFVSLPSSDKETLGKCLESLVSNADFFWPVGGAGNMDDWVVATIRHPNPTGARLSLCGCVELIELASSEEWPFSLLDFKKRILGKPDL